MKTNKYLYMNTVNNFIKDKTIFFGFYRHFYDKEKQIGFRSYFWGKYSVPYGDMIVNVPKEIKKIEHLLRRYDYDDAYFFGNAIGEIFWFMHFFTKYCKKNGSTKPIILSQRKFMPILAKMFVPNIQCVQFWSELYWKADSIKPFIGKKHRFFFPFNENYFIKIENKHNREEKCHFFQNIMSTFKLNKVSNNVVISKKDISEATKILNTFKKPFIVLLPEANSNSTLSDYFWDKLEKEIKQIGFDVFINTSIDGLSLAGLYYLSSKAICVIGVRSGAIDLVSEQAKKMIIYYLPFSKRPHFTPLASDIVLKNFTLKKVSLIKVKDLIEMDTSLMAENLILSFTISNLLNLKTKGYKNGKSR